MAFRRRLHRLRSRKGLVLGVVAVSFLGICLTYLTLSDSDSNSHVQRYAPSLDDTSFGHQVTRQQQHQHQQQPRRRASSAVKQNVNTEVKAAEAVLSLLYPEDWRTAKAADEMALILKDKLLELGLSSPMSCGEISSHRIVGSQAASQRKFIDRLERFEPRFNYFNPSSYSGKRQRPLTMKSQATDIQTKIACMKQMPDSDFCSPMGNYLLLREVFLLRFLQHPNLISLRGYCLRGDGVSGDMTKKGVVLVLEGGVPLNPVLVLNLSWSRRLQLALDVASLMVYLQESPLGSVGLPRIQQKDFVLVDDKSLKLTDVDEADVGEKQCSSVDDCLLEGADMGVPCKKRRCVGLNQKVNMRVMGTYVINPLLQNSPQEVHSVMEKMVDQVQRLNVTSVELVSFLMGWVKKFSAPDTPAPPPQQLPQAGSQAAYYEKLGAFNYPGQHDFACPDSRVLWGCVLVMDTLAEAMQRCTVESVCQAIVVFSSNPELQSRLTVIFKNGHSSTPHNSPGTTLFIRRAPTPSPPSQGDREDKSEEEEEYQGAEDTGREKDKRRMEPTGGERRVSVVTLDEWKADEEKRFKDGLPERGGGHSQNVSEDLGLHQKDTNQADLPANGNTAEEKAGLNPQTHPGEDRVPPQGQQDPADSTRLRRDPGPAESKERDPSQGDISQRDPSQGDTKGGDTRLGTTQKSDPLKETQECERLSRRTQDTVLRNRERRLMSLVGLRGVREQDWRQDVKVKPVGAISEVRAASGQGALGGEMLVGLGETSADHNVTQARFLVKEGPQEDHVSMAMVYYLDRLLGIYRTPPAVEGFLSAEVVKTFSVSSVWLSSFNNLLHQDGSLRGLFVAAPPKPMHRLELRLKPLPEMVLQVAPFNRTQKEHLENVLLGWLGHISRPNSLHLQYKGHLLTFDGDRGFLDLAKDEGGYLNHCQFPGVVYNMLMCFRCRHGADANRICFLGQEVIRQVEEAGFRLFHGGLQKMTPDEYPPLINTAASRMMDVVDRCIKKFGQEVVLY